MFVSPVWLITSIILLVGCLCFCLLLLLYCKMMRAHTIYMKQSNICVSSSYQSDLLHVPINTSSLNPQLKPTYTKKGGLLQLLAVESEHFAQIDEELCYASTNSLTKKSKKSVEIADNVSLCNVSVITLSTWINLTTRRTSRKFLSTQDQPLNHHLKRREDGCWLQNQKTPLRLMKNFVGGSVNLGLCHVRVIKQLNTNFWAIFQTKVSKNRQFLKTLVKV